mgnify:CR=1 FL=1
MIYSTQMENHRYALIAFNVNTQVSHILLEQETKIELILSHNETTLLIKCGNETYFFVRLPKKERIDRRNRMVKIPDLVGLAGSPVIW